MNTAGRASARIGCPSAASKLTRPSVLSTRTRSFGELSVTALAVSSRFTPVPAAGAITTDRLFFSVPLPAGHFTTRTMSSA